ncbi:MAG: hypothetical protein AB3X41_11865 [Leptothrix ochracea]|uniref:hypothetical protein n=1 Tax=Leptothrix ochracea TaxID=735331 RepID=UPI0034E1E7F9
MRIAIVAFAIVLALWAGEWVYRSFLRPIDQPTEQMLALARQFNDSGLKGHIYAVKHGFRHSEVVAAAAFQIDGFPLPVSFEQCPTEVAAEAHLQFMQRGPNLMHPQRNGLLVMYLPMWGDDTEAMARKVTNAFASLKAGT